MGAEDIRDPQRFPGHGAAGFTGLSYSSPSLAAVPTDSVLYVSVTRCGSRFPERACSTITGAEFGSHLGNVGQTSGSIPMPEKLVYKEIGIFVNNEVRYGGVHDSYWGMMGQEICDSLGSKDEICSIISPAIPTQGDLLRRTVRSDVFPKFFLFFNFLPRLNNPEGSNLLGTTFDNIPTRIVRMILDHPVHITNDVRVQIAAINQNPSLRPLRIFTVMESKHIPALERLGISREQIFVMPQAGPPLLEDVMPLKDRTIPLLFSGTIPPLGPDGEFAHQIGCGDPSLRAAVEESVAEVLDGHRDVFEIVTDKFAEPIENRTVADPHKLTVEIDRRGRTLRRHLLFATLRDFPIRFFGEFSDDFKRANPNGIYAGNLSWREVLHRMADSQIVVNDTINLRESALTRFYNSLVHGAVVATDMNEFLKRSFKDGEAIVALNHRGDENASKIRSILDDPAGAQSIADRARAIYSESHTWDHRIDGLIEAIRC